jgi:hypothetical protein
LRTSFCLQDSEVLQIIHPPGPFPLDEEVTGGRNVDAVVEQWLEQERTTPFDLASGRLIRARLLAVDHQHHLLLLNHHPIACDGWSRSLLVRDLTELYNARLTGQASKLVPLQVKYHDYAVWQRQRLCGDHLQTLKDYWIPQLTGLEPLDLPSDHPRPSTQSLQGAAFASRSPLSSSLLSSSSAAQKASPSRSACSRYWLCCCIVTAARTTWPSASPSGAVTIPISSL